MRKLALALLAITGIYGCSNTQGNTLINGQIKGLNKGQLLLQKIDDTMLVSMDSLRIYASPEFSFSIDVTEPEVLYLA